MLPDGCARCSMHGPRRALCGVKLPLKRNSSRVCRLFSDLHFGPLDFECKERQLMPLDGVFQLEGLVSLLCVAPSGMHNKRRHKGGCSRYRVLLAVVGGDGQLHMAFPASVANVRGSRVGSDSAARARSRLRGGFSSCHLLLFEHGWENLGGMRCKNCISLHLKGEEDTPPRL